MIKPKLNLIDQRFGRLTVLRQSETEKYGKVTWLCRCDCGKELLVTTNSLRRGNTKSCGCGRIDATRAANTKHGKRGTRLYKIWAGMLQRTTNASNPNYSRYGGRGIFVCDEWRDDFPAFYQWAMANGYRDGLTIDRADNDGNYEPSNCRWVTRAQQASNRSSNNLITYDGQTMTLTEWSVTLGLNRATLNGRLYEKNWSVERALETPPQRRASQ